MSNYCRIYDARKCMYPFSEAIDAGIRRGDLIELRNNCVLVFDGVDYLNLDFEECQYGCIPKSILANFVDCVHPGYWVHATHITLGIKNPISNLKISNRNVATPLQHGACFVYLDENNISNLQNGFILLKGVKHQVDTNFSTCTLDTTPKIAPNKSGLYVIKCYDDATWSIT